MLAWHSWSPELCPQHHTNKVCGGACHLSTWEVEAGGSRIQGEPLQGWGGDSGTVVNTFHPSTLEASRPAELDSGTLPQKTNKQTNRQTDEQIE